MTFFYDLTNFDRNSPQGKMSYKGVMTNGKQQLLRIYGYSKT